jgi:sugar lactone lactonase YvrE
MLLAAAPALAQGVLPAGFTSQAYVDGQGAEPRRDPDAPSSFPTLVTIAADHSGTLYLARSAFRFRESQAEDLAPIYRFPIGGARITPETEPRYLYGPPLRNPRIAGINAHGDVFVSTYDRDRKLGAVYLLRDGRAALFAGGTPPPGSPPLLRQPETVAFDPSGNIYVVDAEQELVSKLDPAGKVINPRFVTGFGRGRLLVFDGKGQLWIGSDGPATASFQDASGQVWRTTPEGTPTLVFQGALPSGMSLSPGGSLFVSQRRSGKIFALTPDGRQLDFADLSQNTILRTLAFAPVTPETRRAGIGGNLFLVTSPRNNFQAIEVVRITGPFDDFIQRAGR